MPRPPITPRRGAWTALAAVFWLATSCGGRSGDAHRVGAGGSSGLGSGGDAGATGKGGASATGGAPTGGGSTGGSAGAMATGGTAGGPAGANATGGAQAGGPGPGGEAGAPSGGAGASAGTGADSGQGGAGAAGSGGAGAGAGGTSGGVAGSAGASGPHCAGVAPTCGSDGSSDCCASAVIPGGTFDRSNQPANPATVSSFRLDTYEVSVGRFRQFLAGFPQSLPAPGSGKNPNDADDMGWDASFDASLEVDAAALRTLIGRCGNRTFTPDAGANEALPMNCVTWFEAQAFCIWDEGRLPTEAEWNYAAAGGSEQRFLPWSSPPESQTVDATYAVYQGPIETVGSRSPKGDGKWGNADLAGNVFEWVLDYLDVYPLPCVDCANHTPAMWRGDRGGSASTASAGQLPTSYRGNLPPAMRAANVGVRCARSP